ncbi:MAG: NAD-dependent deacylase [Bryobacteraceae bacterium]|nr:NAD-dependent deacylase [Bryobacteraceae bacterium]
MRALLRSARSVAALTGAGISAESGVPTFRGAGGLWRDFRPEELATPQAFSRDAKLVWEWYEWRRGLIAKTEPNAGHRALAEFEGRCPDFTLITQNVDGLHDRAGSRNVLKVHGDLWDSRCTRCSRSWRDFAPLNEIPPLCECGAIARPGVVWFGEALPRRVWFEAEKAARECQLLLVIGTSAVVYPAAGLASLARTSGAKLVEVNIDETPVSSQADYSLRGPAGEILPQLLS